jgi:hypothetical protein
VIRWCGPWVANARPNEQLDPDWLALRLYLARAYKRQADAEEAKDSSDTRLIRESLGEARALLLMVARYSSDFRAEAQQLLGEVGGLTTPRDAAEPRTFSEAKDAGKEALERFETTRLVVARLSQQIAAAGAEGSASELRGKLAEAQKELESSRQEAYSYLDLALRLADQDTSSDALSVVRYYLAYLYYSEQRLYESAVLAEFVARRSSDTAGSRQCAKIALVAYRGLYEQQPPEDREFETTSLVSMADYIVRRWPGQPEADEAINMLIPLMINRGDFDQALALLQNVPSGSQERSVSELKLGRAMWNRYLEQSNASSQGPSSADLETLRVRAEELLAQNLPKISHDRIDATTAAAALSLSQLFLKTQRPEMAVAIIDHPAYGPLTSLREGRALPDEPSYEEETYKAALGAYIGVLAKVSDAGAVVRKAQQVMAEMKAAWGESQASKDRLVGVYVGLAHDLEVQLRQSPPEARRSLAQGFESFLEEIAAEATDLSVLNWVAETFLSLGSGFEDSTPADAEAYYGAAANAFQRILDTKNLDTNTRVQLQLRKALAQRRMQDFSGAVDTLDAVLRENAMMLNVQVDAAHTYQEWAEATEQSAHYESAMFGGRPDGESKRNIIWGWDKIAKATAAHAQFQDTFHEARYNLALCRYQTAESRRGDQRKELLAAAKRDITLTQRLYGLGNEQWVAKYDALLKRIQRSNGERAVGLGATKTTPTSASKKPSED